MYAFILHGFMRTNFLSMVEARKGVGDTVKNDGHSVENDGQGEIARFDQ